MEKFLLYFEQMFTKGNTLFNTIYYRMHALDTWITQHIDLQDARLCALVVSHSDQLTSETSIFQLMS